ncbi:hypothetical protein [Sulfurimonas sp.]|uniref:hypothetical protein n=1 Tax=Sulfurimonas sp. TaxID=2022749 RepID=UPI003564A469
MKVQTNTTISLSLDYYCQFDLVPKADGCINVLLLAIIFFGFLFIVLRSEKYKYLTDYIIDKFGRWF